MYRIPFRVLILRQTDLKLDSLSFLTLITKLQSHSAFDVRIPDFRQTFSTLNEVSFENRCLGPNKQTPT